MADTAPTRRPIVFCPVCVTPDDAPSFGRVTMTCEGCGTQWSATLDEDIVREHAAH